VEWDPARRRHFRFPWRTRAEVQAEVDEELAFHLSMRMLEFEAQGVPRDEARREAMDRFGDLQYTRKYCVSQGKRKEEHARRKTMLDEFRQDVTIGCRRLWKARGFSLVAVLTLALGIGANVAVFSLVNSALLRALPYADPSRLVILSEGIPKADLPKIPFSPPDYLDFARDQRSFETLAAFLNLDLEMGGSQIPRRIVAARVTSGLFPTLGVPPAIGRWFTADEDRRGASLVVLSHTTWRRDLGGRRDVIGATVTLDRRPYEVIGVMPATFQFPPPGVQHNDTPADLWLPMSFTPAEREARGSFFRNGVIGRMRRGVSIEQVRAELPVLTDRTWQGYPLEIKNAGLSLTATAAPLQEEVVGDVRAPLLVLLAAVGLVLLVACANVAGLFLSRAASREHEMTVMAALGASRQRLRQMLLTESLMLGLLSGLAGTLLAWWVTSVAPAAVPDALGRLADSSLDLRVISFAVTLSVTAAVLLGLAPMATTVRVELQDALRATSGTLAASRRRMLQQGLVVGTVALAVVLLVGAGLLGRSFAALVQTDVGVRTEGVLTASFSLPLQAYENGNRVKGFVGQLVERLQTLPGVRAGAVSSDLPLAGREHRAFTPDGSPFSFSRLPRTVTVTWVTAGHFRALGIPLERGRLFTSLDREDGEPTVIVSSALARRVWPGLDPIGKRLKWGIPESTTPWMTVVGVVGDVKDGGIEDEPTIHVYQALAQAREELFAEGAGALLRTLCVTVRSSADPLTLVEPIGRAVADLDPALPLTDVRTMTERVAATRASRRFSLALMAVFGAGALLMAAIGIYGLLAYGVAQRTREFGVRLALGANGMDIVALVARQGLRLMTVGLVIGLFVALALTRFMASLLYQTEPSDPWTFAAVPVVLVAIALVACYLPARRAARIEPVRALRD
jgi:predicted permease